uniref:Uncharacterized protein n=1 Tax=Meloidogyne enterolobii TaxID=390850 RepID=A0A6V7WRK4_MELEN|nr:unnamed protein product [Meloidogyne enterolobii]
MPQWPKKPLDIVLSQTTPEALDLVSRLLIFAPHKRLNVEQCLEHPYVSQFHNKAEEPSLDYEVRLPLPDHIQLSVHEYRDKLYEIISTKKVNIQRINYPNINDKNTACNGWVDKQHQQHQNGETKEQQKRRQSTTTKEQHLKEQQQNVLEKNSVVNNKLEKEKTTTNVTTNEKHKNNKRVIQQTQQQQHSNTTTSPLPSIKTTKTLNKQQTQQQQETSPTDSEKTPKHVVKHLKNNNVGIEKKNNNGNINGGLKQQNKFNNKHEIGSSPSVERNTSGGHYGRKIGLVSNGITTSATMSRSMSESKGLNHHQNGGGLIHSKLQQNNNQAPIALAEPSDTDLDTCSSTSSGLTMGNGGGKTAKIMGSNGTLLNEQQQQQHQNTRRSFGNLFSNIIQKQQHSNHQNNNVDDVSVIRARAQSIESSTATTTNYPSKFSLRTRSREKVKSSKEDQQQQQNLYIDGKQQQKSATNSRRSHDRLRIFLL